MISIYDVPKNEDPEDYADRSRLEITLPKDADEKRVNVTNIIWLNVNESLLVTFDNGAIRLYNPQNGEEIDGEEIFPHKKKIIRVSFNRGKTLFIISSTGFTSKLYDVVNMKHLKTYRTDRPVNDAVIFETKDHILLGRGMDATGVTTFGGANSGKFETFFFIWFTKRSMVPPKDILVCSMYWLSIPTDGVLGVGPKMDIFDCISLIRFIWI